MATGILLVVPVISAVVAARAKGTVKPAVMDARRSMGYDAPVSPVNFDCGSRGIAK
jgi:hypothetical protein